MVVAGVPPRAAQAQLVRTGYTSIVASSTAQCLDIAGASANAGATAIQWPCNFAANEQWAVVPYSKNAFFIVVQQTGDCLSVAGASTSAGAQIVQEPCSPTGSELWSFTASGSGFQIVNGKSSQCLRSAVAGGAAGTVATQAVCATSADFIWIFSSGLMMPTTLSVAQAGHSGQCLNVNGASSAAGAQIIQRPCAGASNEQWAFVPEGADYEIVSKESGLCVSNGGNIGEGFGLVQEPCSASSTSDLWTLQPEGGAFEVVSANTGYCIAIGGSSQSVGANAIQWKCDGGLEQKWSLSAATLPSSWSVVTQLAVDPIAVANLPNGTLLMWSAYDEYTYEGDIGDAESQTYTSVFTPSTGASTSVLVTNTGADMFCPGTANLFNGNILVNGGSSSPKTTIYNLATGAWSSDVNMNVPRGYEGDTVLTNGSVLTLGGSWSGGYGGKTAEVWTAGGAGWTELPGVPETNIIGPDPQGVYRGDNHLWLFSAPNGDVFQAGPSAQMNWITTSGGGTITSAGNRGNDPYAINGNAVLYDIGLIMKTGGAPAYQDANAEANTYLININNGTAGVSVTEAAPMAYPRAFSNAVVLPNGQVVVIGGQTYPVPFSDTTAILTPEIWDPQTHIFRQLNPMQTPRVYHSTGILLSDGTVYEGGGGQCGQGCSANHFNTEILTPPYLLNANGTAATRPVISSAPATAALGSTITVTTQSPVMSFVLMRLSSVTHTVNNDQRRVPLTTSTVNGSTYSVAIPTNPGIALPGYYWLFALNAQGVPSLGSVILIT